MTTGIKQTKEKKENIKYFIFKPASQITTRPLIATNKAVPKSGWVITKKIGIKITIIGISINLILLTSVDGILL